MAKFEIQWAETVWYTTIIEADTVDEAKELFYDGEFSDSDQMDSYFEEIRMISEIGNNE